MNSKLKNENLDKLMKKIDVLIASIEPLASSQQSINSSKKTTTTIVNNATNTNNVMGGQDNNSFRDIPYIERSKYRQNMIYARGLL
jgi:2-keto-4-pentenoate hydratase